MLPFWKFFHIFLICRVDDLQWMTAPNETPIPIPTRFGKILIKRQQDGVHAKGLKVHNIKGKIDETVERVDALE